MTDEERKEMYWIYAAIFAVWAGIAIMMTFIAWMFGARFDLMFEHIKEVVQGVLSGDIPGGRAVKQVVEGTPGRVEL